MKSLIANRGEIAVRIARAAADLADEHNELASIDDPSKRAARYLELVDSADERGRALSSGAPFASTM